MFRLPSQTEDDIEAVAEEVWDTAGQGILPVDTRRILQHFGIILLPARDLPLTVEAEFDFTNFPFKLFVNADSKSLQRQRFTHAHEIGHYKLHINSLEKTKYREAERHVADSVYEGNIVTAELEIEANAFAASLLMPRRSFLQSLREVNKHGNSFLFFAKERYGVSDMAVIRRIARLRPGPLLSGHAFSDSGKIIEMIPTRDLDASHPRIADSAWKLNEVPFRNRKMFLPKKACQLDTSPEISTLRNSVDIQIEEIFRSEDFSQRGALHIWRRDTKRIWFDITMEV